jgi:hypothetical protein
MGCDVMRRARKWRSPLLSEIIIFIGKKAEQKIESCWLGLRTMIRKVIDIRRSQRFVTISNPIWSFWCAIQSCAELKACTWHCCDRMHSASTRRSLFVEIVTWTFYSRLKSGFEIVTGTQAKTSSSFPRSSVNNLGDTHWNSLTQAGSKELVIDAKIVLKTRSW